MLVLVVDVGGNHVKFLVTGQGTPREFDSGRSMTPEEMVSGVLKAAEGWKYDVVSIGYPGAVLRDKPVSEPHNLGPGWVGFDFDAGHLRGLRGRSRIRTAGEEEMAKTRRGRGRPFDRRSPTQ